MAKQIERRRGDGDLFEDTPAPVKGWIVAHCDGGSRGNPGPSGFGVLIQDKNGAILAELSEFLGKRTNNYAEYSALLAALNFAVEQGHPRLRVISDSELMVKQVKGLYRVNSPDLKPMHEEARHRIALLESFDIQHVLREKNRKADELANLAMDRGTGRPAPPPRATQQEADAPVPPAGTADFSEVKAAFPRAVAPPVPRAPIPIGRPVPAHKPLGAEPGKDSRHKNPDPVRGFVKGGVVHLLDGARLPDGTFVKVTRDD